MRAAAGKVTGRSGLCKWGPAHTWTGTVAGAKLLHAASRTPAPPTMNPLMQTLADRAVQSLAHHPAPALPLDELVHQVRHGGAVVGPEVLLRALEARPDQFRVLDPWRAATARAGNCGRREPGERWVVALGCLPCDRGPAGRLRASLAHLGRTVDERSVTDLVRWLGMVREGERVSRAGGVSIPDPEDG